MNLFQFLDRFPTELSIIEYFIKTRFKDGICCPHCGAEEKVYHKRTAPKNFNCRACDTDFSIFTGTIFENSSTDLRKWFYAINLMLISRKGISAMQLKREIGVTYKTAWRMLHQIRAAMGNEETERIFKHIVEIDETFVGGKPRKFNRRKKDDDDPQSPPVNKRGRGTKKAAVVGVLERSSGKVVAQAMFPDKNGRKLTSGRLLYLLETLCEGGTGVMTDQFAGYSILEKRNCNGMVRLSVDHSKRYVDGCVHTNGIESFWATLKRGIHGIYHHVSKKYLQKYVDEFAFRASNRDEGAFMKLVNQCILV